MKLFWMIGLVFYMAGLQAEKPGLPYKSDQNFDRANGPECCAHHRGHSKKSSERRRGFHSRPKTGPTYEGQKPIIDWYGDRDLNPSWARHPFYERPDFVLVGASPTGSKHADVALVSELALDHIDAIRAKGYKRIIGYLYESGFWRWPGKKPGEELDKELELWAQANLDKYDLILTHKKYLLDHYPDKCKFLHAFGFGTLRHHGIHEKTKLCSHMVSKNQYLEGHKLRWEAAEKYKQYFDACKGGDAPFVEWKDPWLNDFCFSVIIENQRESHYFSEKILECFRAGTIPIYWGCPTIGEFFDEDGILIFDNIEELGVILQSLSKEEYQKRLPSVRRNFELAGKYPQYRLGPCAHNAYVVKEPEDTWHYSIDEPDVFDGIWPYMKPFFDGE